VSRYPDEDPFAGSLPERVRSMMTEPSDVEWRADEHPPAVFVVPRAHFRHRPRSEEELIRDLFARYPVLGDEDDDDG
jgi:hypothetical protein